MSTCPLEASKPLKILLGERASQALTEAGADSFVVVGRESYPGDPARWVVYLIPCTIAQADSAARVAQGKSFERKPRKP